MKEASYKRLHIIWNSRIGKCIETDSRFISGCLRLEGERNKGVNAKGYGISFWSDSNVLILTVVMVAHTCEYAKKKKLDRALSKGGLYDIWIIAQ